MRSTVLASLEIEDGTQCVDFFLREDGNFGQYRGDHDGPNRWQSLSTYSGLSFCSGEEALQVAKQHVRGLAQQNSGAGSWRRKRWSPMQKSTARTASGGLSLKTSGSAPTPVLPSEIHFGHVAFVLGAG